MSRGVQTITLLKTTWSSGYDPLLMEFWGPGSTPGVVLRKYIFCLQYNKDFILLTITIYKNSLMINELSHIIAF